MPPRLLLSVKDAMVRYSEKPVFENLAFNIHENARIALVGNNGTGKTTLMNIITGRQDLDAGERWQEIGITTGYLHQKIDADPGQSVFEFIFSEITHEERDLHAYKVDIVAEALDLDVGEKMSRLSGGQLRRAGLARALVEEPDILLLDEPTNHLDLEAIEWLETYLKNYRGTLLCVSHDRAFLANITNQVFWLDRGKLKVSPRGFAHFDEWSTLLLEQEERELKNRKQIVALETEWASRGVKARRKRNQRRLQLIREAREKLKSDQISFNKAVSKISMTAAKGMEANSKIVSEFYNVSKIFRDDEKIKTILDKFSLRIQRGDRIGILGKNGSGKTTFLKLLIGEIAPDQGSVKRRKELEFSYFDQKRSTLDHGATLRKTLAPGGGDHITVMGKQRHVCGYLKDFLFDPARVDDRVSTLSGGQKNRLMLAKILADPKSCLILDEPTNDLDMDTLDMLAETLSLYQGTLIVVSHDRDFLDQTVTRILAFEGDGKIERCIGGYSDYLNMKKHSAPAEQTEKRKPKEKGPEILKNPPLQKKSEKLTYKLEHELSGLPKKIAELENQIRIFNERLSDPDFYGRDADGFHAMTKNLLEAQRKLERYELRWLELTDLKDEKKS